MTRTIAMLAALLGLAMTAPAASATTGPVGHWRLDEGRGSLVRDSSGFGDDGTVLGGASWVSAPTGGALRFDGATGSIQIPDAAQLEPAGGVSVSAWVARDGTPSAYRYILAKGGTGCIAAAYGLYTGPSGGLQFYVSRNRGTRFAPSPDAGQGVWDGHWHLVVGTFDGVTIRLYVDGAEVGSGTVYPGALDYFETDSNDLYIGNYPGCHTKNFLGNIADVQVWDRALDPGEVSALAGPAASPSLPPVSSGQGPGAGQPGTTTTTTTQPATTQPASNRPILRMLKLSRPSHASPAAGARLVVTYTDSQSARVTFTIFKIAQKHGCLSRGSGSPPASRACTRSIRLGIFTHADHPGRNDRRLPAGLRLASGRYLLLASPSAHGVLGPTVKVTFTVAALHRRGG